jgi:anti-sigma factor RsiW
MSRWTEPEMLVAYVDGVLAADDLRAVEDALATDAEARESVRRLREDAALLRGAFNGPLDEPLPERTLAILAAASEEANIVPLRPGGRWGGGPPGWRFAVAASIAAFVVGVSASYFVADYKVESELARLRAAEAAIVQEREDATFEALEQRVSGETVNWENPDGQASGSVTPVRTFRVEDGRWCREYLARETLSGVSEAKRAVACREPEGRWTTQLVALEDS